ncbi:hypothetical protein, partial [Cupriavidus taiwanensis]|uniref:hypothetical protein n=1 Tax=Cupriavidus taiwanensis TaxID=164546 RepID=UPI001F11F404
MKIRLSVGRCKLDVIAGVKGAGHLLRNGAGRSRLDQALKNRRFFLLFQWLICAFWAWPWGT